MLGAASIVLGTALSALADNPNDPTDPNNSSKAKVPSINLILKSYVDTGSDQISSPGDTLIDGQMRIGGRVTIPFTSPAFPFKNLVLRYEHDNSLHTEARVTASSGLYDYPGSRYDQTDKFTAGYDMGNFSVMAGYFYKHRVCCPAASDPTNTRPSTEHLANVTVSDKFGPRRYGTSLFSADLTGWRSLNHQQGPVTKGYSNLGDLYLYSTSVTMQTSIDRRHFFEPYIGVGISNDYYDNRPVPYYLHTVKMGINSRLSSIVTLTANLSNLTEFNEGYPYAFPNTIHYTELTLEAVIHIPLRHR
jgi:outer membrane protein W